MLYLWVKAAHLICVIAWMASLVIFPRYKIHQMSSSPGEALFETMKSASARLRSTIMTPMIVVVWVLGLTLLWINPALLSTGWMGTKLLLVFAMSGFHGYFVSLGRKIDNGQQPVTAKTLRLINELPFVLMIVIVILAIVKPF